MTQLPLPFPRLRVPALHVYWLTLANAGEFPSKRVDFYPFKTRFLQAHGLVDGYDLQVIVKKCYCGDGIFRGTEHTLPEHAWQACYRCSGTGIYLRKKIALRRWLLGGEVFHEPLAIMPTHAPRETINGLVKHTQTVPDAHAVRAFHRLLLRYEPLTLWTIQIQRMRNGVARLKWQWQLLRWRMEDDAGTRFAEDNYEDIPF